MIPGTLLYDTGYVAYKYHIIEVQHIPYVARVDCYLYRSLFCFFSVSLLSSFWASCGLRCRPPRYVPSFLTRIGFSVPTARRFSSNVAKGPSYRVEKHLFSENQKSKFPFDWSECQHAAHGDFDISEILFSAKKSWGTFSEELYLFYSKFMRSAPPSVPNIQSRHWYLHLSRDTHENTRASTHSKIPRKMSNPPPDQQTAPRGTRNQHLGQLCLSLIHI